MGQGPRYWFGSALYLHCDGDADPDCPSAHPLQVELVPVDPAAEHGSGLVLTCRAFGCLHHPILIWRRTDQDGSVLQKTQTQDGQSLLHLQDLDLLDQGGYSCEATCGTVVRSNTTQIQVLCESKQALHSIRYTHTLTHTNTHTHTDTHTDTHTHTHSRSECFPV